MIRGNNKKCPFGLSIPDGCKCIGGLESQMITTKDSDFAAIEHNKEMALLGRGHCKYANIIFEKKNLVNCSFSEQGEQASNIPLDGSPNYPHIYIGNETRATGTYPEPYYPDDNIRSIYYGLVQVV